MVCRQIKGVMMKKILCTLAALSLMSVACSREDSVSSRVEDMPQYEKDMDTEIGTGVSDERRLDSGVEAERDSMDSEMDMEREEMDIQREEEEMIPRDEVEPRRGTGTGAGSSDASGMGMDE
jgi:hypothetical protein